MRKFLSAFAALALALLPLCSDATIQYSVTQQNTNMAGIVANAGATAYLLIYTGSPPANCAASATGTLLVSLPMSSTIGTVSNGLLTMNTITAENAVANGTAGYWRIATSSAGTTVVAQGTVDVSSADLNFPSVVWTSGETISITSFTIKANGS